MVAKGAPWATNNAAGWGGLRWFAAAWRSSDLDAHQREDVACGGGGGADSRWFVGGSYWPEKLQGNAKTQLAGQGLGGLDFAGSC